MRTSAPDWAALGSGLAGELELPESPDYEKLRKPPDARFHDVRPLAVVRCASPADIAETLGFVRRAGLDTLAIRSGGHCFAGRSSTHGVLLDVTPMRAVSVSGDRVRIGAGARLAEVYDELAAHGLTIPAGCGPTVGIAGLTLGGGLGVLGRVYGLTCDRLRAARVVLADGRVVECDDQRHPDLFWAVCGGVGGFGVVTDLEFAPVPAPAMTSFRLEWVDQHAAVVDAWQRWASSAPDELAASLLVSVPGDLDQPPEAALVGTMLGSTSDAAPYLDELVARVGVEPASSASVEASHRETKRRLAAAGNERDEGYAFTKSGFFAQPMPSDTVAGLVRQLTTDRMPGQARVLDCTPWGGAYTRVSPDATAFVHRAERFLVQHLAVVRPDAPGGVAAGQDWLRESYRLTEPARSGGVYQNFPDPELADPGPAYFGANLDRLRQVNARYDPDRFFRAPYDIR